MTDNDSLITKESLHYYSGGLMGSKKDKNIAKIWPIKVNKGSQGTMIIDGVSDDTYLKMLENIGLIWIGTEEIITKNSIPSRVWTTFTEGACQTLDVYSLWSDIAYSAHKAGNIEATKQARKVNFGLISASLRLRDVAKEYHFQLFHALGNGIKPDLRFTNVDILNLFLALHSLLAEMCSVRDGLAGFASRVIFTKTNAVDSMGGLYKQLKKTPVQHPLADKILEICDKNSQKGWMAWLGQHRDNIMHNAPMPQHHNNDFVSYKLYDVKNINVSDVKLPFLTYMINSNPYDTSPTSSKVDALVFFRQMFLGLSQFAEVMVAFSPIRPETRSITPIGEIKVEKVEII